MARAEDLVQQAIVEGINTFCPGCYAFAVPNAARRTAGGRAGNAVPGLRRGVFDLCIHGPWQRVFYMEVKKDERETLSKEQIQFQEQMTLRGISTAVCWSLETAMTQMKAWGLLQVGIIINGKRI